ncbi:hypothetical protein PIB30_105707, partial [Stylosanthes scabra]|nr:hypothetical protein [Stylosanthes scabra]
IRQDIHNKGYRSDTKCNSPAASTILSALVGKDDGQRPPTLTQPHGFVSDDRDDGL